MGDSLSYLDNLLVQVYEKARVCINLKKAGVGQPKYCNNAYVHVVLTNLCSIFSIIFPTNQPKRASDNARTNEISRYKSQNEGQICGNRQRAIKRAPCK